MSKGVASVHAGASVRGSGLVLGLGLVLLPGILGACNALLSIEELPYPPADAAGDAKPEGQVTVTWNAADKAPTVALTGGALTATITDNPTGWGGVRTTVGRSSGKYYVELTVDQQNSSLGNHQFGLATSAASLLQPSPAEALIFDLDRSAYADGTFLGSVWSGATTGHVIGMAIDLDAALVWVRDLDAATGWNSASNGVQDPGSGQGGISLATVHPPVFVIWLGDGLATPSDQVTGDFGATVFVGGIPGGFVAWDE